MPSKSVNKNYIPTVGRRKTAVARVRLIKNGSGKIIVNEKDYKEYFPTVELSQILEKALKAVDALSSIDITIKVVGGGQKSQAEASSLGIARALVVMDKDLKSNLKKLGLLKRDSRKKERKKPGLRGARRAPQWSKR